MAACAQCVRVRLMVPEAVHQLSLLPGLHLSGTSGNLAEGMATPDALASLRAHGLVRSVEVLPTRVAPEQLEPMTATVGNGLMALFAEAAPKLLLVLLGLAVVKSWKQG